MSKRDSFDVVAEINSLVSNLPKSMFARASIDPEESWLNAVDRALKQFFTEESAKIIFDFIKDSSRFEEERDY